MRRWLAAACLLASAEAAAHAELVSSSPADGTALTTSPPRIELRFNEPVRALSLSLADAAGGAVAIGPARVEGHALRADIAAALVDGHYILSYRVVSLDSHPVSGAIAFGVGAGPPPAPTATEVTVSPARVAVRTLRDLALLVAAGGALFIVAVGAFPRQRVLAAAAVAGAACALCAVALQGTGWHSSFGLSACVACLGLAVVAVGALSGRKTVLGLGAALVVASLPLTGHTVGRPLAMVALAGHGLAAAFWLGSLVALLILLRQGRPVRELRRFSSFGVAAVALLLACGLVMAVLQIDAPQSLWRSEYGQLVAAKGLLLVVLAGVALVNRFRLLPVLERGDDRALPALRGTVAFEIGLLAVAMLVTAALVQTPPRAAEREQVLESGGRSATLSFGGRSIQARLREASGAPLEAAEVTLELGAQRVVRPMQRVGAGHYRYEGETYGAESSRVVLHARIGDFDKLTFSPR